VAVAVSRLKFASVRANPYALLAGVLDAGGNVFYVLAGQFVRLDVAAVIASFYPATTVALASLILKEKVTRGHLVGVLLCLGAIVLITL
jgi:drug/metabolite transporter (DMT)-like permease